MAQHKLSARRVKRAQETRPLQRRRQPLSAGQQWRTKSWVFRYRKRQSQRGWHQNQRNGLRPAGAGLAGGGTGARRWPAASCCLRASTPSRRGSISGARSGWRRQAITFGQCADSYIKAHEAGWTNAKHRYQWRQTLDIACETLGDSAGGRRGHWAGPQGAGADLAQEAGNRIPAAPAHRGGAELGHRKRLPQGDNPARWRGHLDNLLPKAPSCGACSTTRRCPMPSCRSSWPSFAPTDRSAPGHWSSRS